MKVMNVHCGKVRKYPKSLEKKIYITHNPITQREPLLIFGMFLVRCVFVFLFFFQIFLQEDFCAVNNFEICFLKMLHDSIGIFPWPEKLCKEEQL